MSASAAEAALGKLSVILPAYNEAENIVAVVEQALDVLPGLVADFEVVVVDDGSTDGTSDVVEAMLAAHHPTLRLLRHSSNRGYGAALRSGFGRAHGDLLFYTDADRQFDLAELAYFLPLARSHDLVIGFRVYRYDTVIRSMLSWSYNRLVSILFRTRVRDVDCAFKLMHREVWEKLALESDDFFVDTEIVARARRWNFRITQKGVRHYPRVAGETTVRPSDIPRTLRTVMRMWRRIYYPSLDRREEAPAATDDGAAIEIVPERAEAP